MTDCNETLRELESFLDHELSGGAHEAIQAHLGGCDHCLETFDFHAELKTVIARKCHNDEMPPGLQARIDEQFAANVGKPHRRNAEFASLLSRAETERNAQQSNLFSRAGKIYIF